MPRELAQRSRISAASPARDVSKTGLIGSVLLHGALVAATFITWQHSFTMPTESPPIVPVELVTLGDKTNIRDMVKTPPKEVPEEKPAPPVEDPAKPEPPPPEPVPPEPVPPEPAPPELKPEPKPEPAPPKPVEKKPEPPKVQPKPKDKPKPTPEKPKKDNFDINSIEALLNKVAPKEASSKAQTGDRNIRGIGDRNAMTMDLIDTLRNQISQCWSLPAGAPNPERLIVRMNVYLAPDGSIARPPQLSADSAAAAARDPYMRTAADAARRAIHVCAPYKLPADRYSVWKEIQVTFDPRLLLGQ